MWPAILSNNATLGSTGWGLDHVHKACACRMLLGLNLLNSDDKTQREKMLKATSPLLAVIAGAGTVEHIGQVVKQANASAVALGSMIVFQKKDMGVLVNFPSCTEIKATLT